MKSFQEDMFGNFLQSRGAVLCNECSGSAVFLTPDNREGLVSPCYLCVRTFSSMIREGVAVTSRGSAGFQIEAMATTLLGLPIDTA